jgi:hypothetical protein
MKEELFKLHEDELLNEFLLVHGFKMVAMLFAITKEV